METWKPIAEYEGLYEVSDLGRVRSISRIVPNGTAHRPIVGRILKQKRCLNAYWGVQLCDRKRTWDVHVHRLVAKAFLTGDGPIVRHLDGDGFNNLPSNLAIGTHKENTADIKRHGRSPDGSLHPLAQLTEAVVADIRRDTEFSINWTKRLGISKSAISKARRRVTWRHVP